MRFITKIILSICFIYYFNQAQANEDQIAFTKTGEEVLLKKNGTWEIKNSIKNDSKAVKIGVINLKQSQDYCTLKFEVQNQTAINFKSYWPIINIIDKNKYRFGSANLQLSIRPKQNAVGESMFSGVKCNEIVKIEIDSFYSCVGYDKKGQPEEFSGCEKVAEPLKNTIMPVVIISQK